MIFRRKKSPAPPTDGRRTDALDRPLGPSVRPVRPLVQSTAASAGLEGRLDAGAKSAPPALRAEPLSRAASTSPPRVQASTSSLPESGRLTIGRDITLNGQIGACERLIVEGSVEGDLADGHTIEVIEGGRFEGKATVETATIAGRFEGALTVAGTLAIQRTGHVEGTVRYGRLEIEAGGTIGGDVKSLAADRPAVPEKGTQLFAEGAVGLRALKNGGED